MQQCEEQESGESKQEVGMPRIVIPGDEPEDSSGSRGVQSQPPLAESTSRRGLLQEEDEGTNSSVASGGSKGSGLSVKKVPSGYSELSDTLSPLPGEGTSPYRSPLRSPLRTSSPLLPGAGLGNGGGGSPFRGSPFRSRDLDSVFTGSSPARSTAGSQISPFKRSLLTPSATFKRLAEAKEEVSRHTPSEAPSFSSRIKDGIHKLGNIDWQIVKQQAREWLWNPKNLALLVWILAVAVSGAILFMVMVGMLNRALPKKKDRDAWFEVNNQILNALFTLMCLYLHPTRFYHAYLLYRWEPRDIVKMRKVYCKNGTRKLHEWFHMTVVVCLLHLNCFAQYALCGLNWGYKRSERPAIGVGVCLSFAIGCSAAAGIYNSLSPLGREFVALDDEEYAKLASEMEKGEAKVRLESETSVYDIGIMNFRLLEKRMSFAKRDGGREKEVENPEWKGGLWDWNMEPGISLLSFVCFVCVFGWNVDRLGFGNRYVHIVTFVLLLTAPFWIFDLAAINLDNYYVRHGIGGAGIALSVFGLLYGGFWRIRMRETFNLPARTWCCRNPRMTDCASWFFLPFCSLCQEVRTAEYYDIKEDKFFVRSSSGKHGVTFPNRDLGTPRSSVHDAPLSPLNLSTHVRDLELSTGPAPMAPPAPQTLSKDDPAP